MHLNFAMRGNYHIGFINIVVKVTAKPDGNYMKRFFAICILLFTFLIGHRAIATEPDPSNFFSKCNQGPYGLCGYFDLGIYKKDKVLKPVIPAKFESVSSFKDGLALVKIDGKYGFINPSGAFTIKPIFESALLFQEGLAAVKLNGKFGFIEPSGKFQIKPSFEIVGSFNKGLAPFYENEKIGFINTQGEIVVPPMFGDAISIDEKTIIGSNTSSFTGKVKTPLPSFGMRYTRTGFPRKAAGIYHLDKGWLNEPKYIFSAFNREDNNLLWAKDGKRGASGLMQLDGQWRTKPEFEYTQRLSDGRAIVTVKQTDGTQLWGAVDEQGDLVVPAKFDYLTAWRKGYGIARKGERDTGTYGLLDKAGNLLGGRYFDEVQRPGNYFTITETVFLPRVKTEGVWYSLSPEGKLIEDQQKAVEIKTGAILSCDNFTITRTKNGATATNKSGKKIVDFDYTNSFNILVTQHNENIAKPCDGPISIQHGQKYGYLLPEGILFANRLFENMIRPHENVAEFSEGGKWGLINSSGKILLDPEYDRFTYNNDGNFLFTKGDKLYAFDINGEEYDLENDPRFSEEFKTRVPPREAYLECSDSALKSKDGKWGIVSDDGDRILPFKYRALTCYKNGMAWAPRDDLQKWCPIDKNGEYLSEDRCKASVRFSNVSHHYPKPLAEDRYESSVLWALEYLNFGEGRDSRPPILLPDGYSGRRPMLMRPPLYVRD